MKFPWAHDTLILGYLTYINHINHILTILIISTILTILTILTIKYLDLRHWIMLRRYDFKWRTWTWADYGRSSQEELDQAMAELKAYIDEFMRKLGGQDGPMWAKSLQKGPDTVGGFGDTNWHTLTIFDPFLGRRALKGIELKIKKKRSFWLCYRFQVFILIHVEN